MIRRPQIPPMLFDAIYRIQRHCEKTEDCTKCCFYAGDISTSACMLAWAPDVWGIHLPERIETNISAAKKLAFERVEKNNLAEKFLAEISRRSNVLSAVFKQVAVEIVENTALFKTESGFCCEVLSRPNNKKIINAALEAVSLTGGLIVCGDAIPEAGK